MDDFTASSKKCAAAAAGILLAGFTIIIHSATRQDVAGSIGGACLIMVALTITICVLVRHWVVNTNTERTILAAATREAQAQRAMYQAAQCALENEQGRLNRDMAAARRQMTASFMAERAKLHAEFEEKHAQDMTDAFQTGVEMERAGMLKPNTTQPDRGTLIPFPGQHPGHAAERERSREHGNVGP